MNSAYRLDLTAGQVLFREGDAPTTAYLIERGRLRVTTERDGKPVVLGELEAGALIGEMAVLDDSPRTATATAIESCELTAIDRTQFAERLAAADPIIRALLLSHLARYRTALATFTGHASPAAPAASAARQEDAADARGKIRLENQLREALDKGELELRLQPIRELASGRTAGYEALIRWDHPERGAVSPAEFIALAEETSLIVPIGEYMLQAVCRVLRRFAQSGSGATPFVGLNVSGRQIEDAQFVERVVAQAHAHEVPLKLLKIEITESLVLDYEKVAAFLLRCRQAGIRVALDDFGTGYSSLAHLHQLAFDTLKLDQAFVRQLEDPRCLAIVRAVIAMAQALGCDIIAEGVETPEQLARLETLGCQFAQGYLIGKPQTSDSIFAAPRS